MANFYSQSGVAPSMGDSPEQVDYERRLAQKMLAENLSTAPLQHPLQVLGKIAGAGVGSMWGDQARQSETAGRAAASKALVDALTSKGDPSAAIASGLQTGYGPQMLGPVAGSILSNRIQQNSPTTQTQLALANLQLQQARQMGPLAVEKAKVELEKLRRGDALDNYIIGQIGGGTSTSSTPTPTPAPAAPTSPAAAASPTMSGISFNQDTGTVGAAPTGGISALTTPQPSPPPAAIPSTAPSPAPPPAVAAAQPPSQKSLQQLLAERSPAERLEFLMAYRKDPAKASEILQRWINPEANADKARQHAMGEAQGKSQADLPRAVESADRMIQQVDSVLRDKSLSRVTGPFDARLPTLRGSSIDTEEKIAQLGGGAFLEAFNTLRGGGQITEVEGKKATDALARLTNLKQSDKGFKTSLKDFRDEVILLKELSYHKAGQQAPPELTKAADQVRAQRKGSTPNNAANTAATAPAKISGDVEFDALPSGAQFIGPDGKLRTKP